MREGSLTLSGVNGQRRPWRLPSRIGRLTRPVPWGSVHPVAGYSGTPLAKKLGIVEGSRVAIVSAPHGFCDELDVPNGVSVRTAARGRLDVLVFFVTRRG